MEIDGALPDWPPTKVYCRRERRIRAV